MNRPIRLVVVAAMLILAGSNPASAKAMQFVCTYLKLYEWEKPGLQDANFVLKFSVDTVTQKGFLTGNQGVTEVSVVIGDSGITFLEILPTGVVQATTVSNSGSSVHSRHTIIADHLLPSQYFGKCTSGT
jgi:hypothetical protein